MGLEDFLQKLQKVKVVFLLEFYCLLLLNKSKLFNKKIVYYKLISKFCDLFFYLHLFFKFYFYGFTLYAKHRLFFDIKIVSLDNISSLFNYKNLLEFFKSAKYLPSLVLKIIIQLLTMRFYKNLHVRSYFYYALQQSFFYLATIFVYFNKKLVIPNH